MSHAVDDLWSVAAGSPQVDAATLAEAVEAAACDADNLDYRSKLLIRDSLTALQKHWGDERFKLWLSASPFNQQIERARDPQNFDPDPEEIGFPSLMRRIADVTRPQQICRYLNDLSRAIRSPTRVIIGGTASMILTQALSRQTEAIVIVNEIPEELRNQHELLRQLTDNHGLRLMHFPPYYLPSDWRDRVRPFVTFDLLQVLVVDPADVFISKLFSHRRADKIDIVARFSKFDCDALRPRFLDYGASLDCESHLKAKAAFEWYVVSGERIAFAS